MAKKAVLVTGAAKGVGAAIAEDLGTHGWTVGVHYFTQKDLADQVVANIRRNGGTAHALQANLASEADTAELIPQACQTLGALTLLVNAASVFEDDTAMTATRRCWDRHMETNLRAPFVLIQHFARQLPESESGCVINVLDQRVLNLTPHYLSYTVSKAGLWTLTRTLALALAPRIRVNGIGPGQEFRPAREADAKGATPAAATPPLDPDEHARSLPLRRRVGVEEVCRAIHFILETPSLTGQMLALDSGEHMGWALPTSVLPGGS
ncbi:SDR family oxidoreductase [Rhodocista pekingensis]|uniref:SDR family oxidoreductase n=1 Tax=Rhodocista pekingensis TaxID=201185 RepID=A0ABW2KTL3_9PROT